MFGKEIYSLSSEKFRDYLKNEVYKYIQDKKLIYLDLLYWINMRKCIYGVEDCNFAYYSTYIQIYEKLRILVKSSKIVCPVSETILSEVSKQTDDTTRINTYKIIDSLSEHLAFFDMDIFPKELSNIQMSLKGKDINTQYFLGTIFTSNPEIAEKYFKSINNGDETPQEIKNKIWESLYSNSSEFCSKYLKHHMPQARDLGDYKNAFDKCKSKDYTIEEDLLNHFRWIVKEFNSMPNYSFYELETITDISIIKKYAPANYILSLIHTIRKRNINETAKNNDFYDDYHAAVALAYSDFFFTERNLCHLLSNKPFDTSYSKTKIETDPNKVLNILNQI